MTLEFLRQFKRTGEPAILAAVELTLEKMARGGIYDQLGGGFHRYSVDERWLVPHFEKMLYDNALLSKLYVDAWLATGKPLYKRITDETLEYIRRDMTDPSGGFYSTEDADTAAISMLRPSGILKTAASCTSTSRWIPSLDFCRLLLID
jgi:uncharacterized protein YyaL (SSP411 family)